MTSLLLSATATVFLGRRAKVFHASCLAQTILPCPRRSCSRGCRLPATSNLSRLAKCNIVLHDLEPDRNQPKSISLVSALRPAKSCATNTGLKARTRIDAPVEQRTELTLDSLQAITGFGCAQWPMELSARRRGTYLTVLSPIWQRWWFIALATITIGLIVYAIYRYRSWQIAGKHPNSIATDLRTTLARISRISMLSEVACHQHGNGSEQGDNPLLSIARIARESVASMSDIVWQ